MFVFFPAAQTLSLLCEVVQVLSGQTGVKNCQQLQNFSNIYFKRVFARAIGIKYFIPLDVEEGDSLISTHRKSHQLGPRISFSLHLICSFSLLVLLCLEFVFSFPHRMRLLRKYFPKRSQIITLFCIMGNLFVGIMSSSFWHFLISF